MIYITALAVIFAVAPHLYRFIFNVIDRNFRKDSYVFSAKAIEETIARQEEKWLAEQQLAPKYHVVVQTKSGLLSSTQPFEPDVQYYGGSTSLQQAEMYVESQLRGEFYHCKVLNRYLPVSDIASIRILTNGVK
jgi:hypothetical protein